MIVEESGKSSQLNPYHRDIDPRLGAGFALFVIPHEAALAHEPAKGPLHHPAPGQNLEAAQAGATFDYLHREFWPQPANPLDKVRPVVAAIDPEKPQPGKPSQRFAQQGPGSKRAPERWPQSPPLPRPDPAYRRANAFFVP